MVNFPSNVPECPESGESLLLYGESLTEAMGTWDDNPVTPEALCQRGQSYYVQKSKLGEAHYTGVAERFFSTPKGELIAEILIEQGILDNARAAISENQRKVVDAYAKEELYKRTDALKRTRVESILIEAGISTLLFSFFTEGPKDFLKWMAGKGLPFTKTNPLEDLVKVTFRTLEEQSLIEQMGLCVADGNGGLSPPRFSPSQGEALKKFVYAALALGATLGSAFAGSAWFRHRSQVDSRKIVEAILGNPDLARDLAKIKTDKGLDMGALMAMGEDDLERVMARIRAQQAEVGPALSKVSQDLLAVNSRLTVMQLMELQRRTVEGMLDKDKGIKDPDLRAQAKYIVDNHLAEMRKQAEMGFTDHALGIVGGFGVGVPLGHILHKLINPKKIGMDQYWHRLAEGAKRDAEQNVWGKIRDSQLLACDLEQQRRLDRLVEKMFPAEEAPEVAPEGAGEADADGAPEARRASELEEVARRIQHAFDTAESEENLRGLHRDLEDRGYRMDNFETLVDLWTASRLRSPYYYNAPVEGSPSFVTRAPGDVDGEPHRTWEGGTPTEIPTWVLAAGAAGLAVVTVALVFTPWPDEVVTGAGAVSLGGRLLIRLGLRQAPQVVAGATLGPAAVEALAAGGTVAGTTGGGTVLVVIEGGGAATVGAAGTGAVADGMAKAAVVMLTLGGATLASPDSDAAQSLSGETEDESDETGCGEEVSAEEENVAGSGFDDADYGICLP